MNNNDIISFWTHKCQLWLVIGFDSFFYRYSSHLPMGGPHRNIKDVTLGGYKVPKDTFVSEHNNRYYLF